MTFEASSAPPAPVWEELDSPPRRSTATISLSSATAPSFGLDVGCQRARNLAEVDHVPSPELWSARTPLTCGSTSRNSPAASSLTPCRRLPPARLRSSSSRPEFGLIGGDDELPEQSVLDSLLVRELQQGGSTVAAKLRLQGAGLVVEPRGE
jgi:hypothetical protein